MIVYAAVEDLAAWLTPTDVPETATRLLRAASFVVAEACNRNPYTDTPTTADAPALNDATCAQAASWIALGIDPDALGLDGPAPIRKSSILGADVEYDTKASVEARSLAARELAPQAAAILTAAGLLWVPVPAGDTSGCLPDWGTGTRWWGPYLEADAWPFQ